ncbi:MAG: hypothetical protein H8D78_16285 [Chloroflexi bacterium]|nr:hypothetical protein [Chloroflexota bacterium]
MTERANEEMFSSALRQLSRELDLSDIAPEMERLWTRSIRHLDKRQVVEWGATIVLTEDKRLRLVGITEGDAEGVTPELEVDEGEEFIGTFHTHPYEDGTTGMAFSGIDIAGAINNGEKISVVQSGRDIFALVRTEGTPVRVDPRRLDQELNTAYRGYVKMGLADQEALLAANLDACEKYRLAFYWGTIPQRLLEVYKP